MVELRDVHQFAQPDDGVGEKERKRSRRGKDGQGTGGEGGPCIGKDHGAVGGNNDQIDNCQCVNGFIRHVYGEIKESGSTQYESGVKPGIKQGITAGFHQGMEGENVENVRRHENPAPT